MSMRLLLFFFFVILSFYSQGQQDTIIGYYVLSNKDEIVETPKSSKSYVSIRNNLYDMEMIEYNKRLSTFRNEKSYPERRPLKPSLYFTYEILSTKSLDLNLSNYKLIYIENIRILTKYDGLVYFIDKTQNKQYFTKSTRGIIE